MNDFDTELDRLEKTSEMLSGAKWAKFENVGDQYQGTYIHRYEAEAPSGQMQVVYVLKTPEGPVNVGRSIRDSRVHRVMDVTKYGQVVRFKHTEVIPNPKKGFNAIKVVEAYTRPDLIDREWLAEQGVTEPITPDLSPRVDEAATTIMDASGDASAPKGFPTVEA